MQPCEDKPAGYTKVAHSGVANSGSIGGGTYTRSDEDGLFCILLPLIYFTVFGTTMAAAPMVMSVSGGLSPAASYLVFQCAIRTSKSASSRPGLFLFKDWRWATSSGVLGAYTVA